MPLDALALGAIANELNILLEDGKIEKVHQPERDELLLVIKTKSGLKKLVLSASSANARIHLTDEIKENPMTPPMFCMLLRKHLIGGRIDSVKRLGFERVVDFKISCHNELGDLTVKHIICETMGRNSNIIFLDQDMRILDSVKHIDLTVSSLRNILPGLKYMMQPDSGRINPEIATIDEYLSVLKKAPEGKETSGAIVTSVMGISPLLAGECVYKVCGNADLRVGELTETDKQNVANELFNLFQASVNNEFSPCVIYSADKKKVIDFAPFLVKQFENGAEILPAETMNKAACEFYFVRDMQARMNDRSSTIVKVVTTNLKRAEKKLDILQGELKEAEKREQYKVFGDIITANMYKIQKGDTKLETQNFYDNGKDIEIPLDLRLTPSQNATKYYTKYKKAKNTELYAAKQIEITISEIEYLESVLFSLSNAQTPQHLSEIREELVNSGYINPERSKTKKDKNPTIGKPMEFEYNGYTIFVGRNNIQNDILTLRMSRSRDLWLHTKNIAGSHTLIKYNGEEFPNKVIEVAASIAAFYSKGKNSPYVEVDYCPVSHVKKPNGSKAGMVVYEGYSTAFVKPDGELADKLRKN